jgi:Uma2 family endonuclease
MTPCDTLPMSTVKLDLDEPSYWTEDAYLSLGETKTKIELIDGGLWVSPSSNIPHNEIGASLLYLLKAAVRDTGLRAVPTSNLRLAPGRIFIPDIVVGRIPRKAVMIASHEAVLVVEITSPGNAVVDRTLKRKLYAEAGIDWYLLVEPDITDYESLGLRLFRREGGDFVTHAEAGPGQTLTSDEPFPLEVDTAALLDF